MSIGKMSLNEIRSCLERGEWLHSSLTKEYIESGSCSRVIVRLYKELGLSEDYRIGRVVESILEYLGQEPVLKELQMRSSTREDAKYVLGFLKGKLLTKSWRGDLQASKILERLNVISKRLQKIISLQPTNSSNMQASYQRNLALGNESQSSLLPIASSFSLVQEQDSNPRELSSATFRVKQPMDNSSLDSALTVSKSVQELPVVSPSAISADPITIDQIVDVVVKCLPHADQCYVQQAAHQLCDFVNHIILTYRFKDAPAIRFTKGAVVNSVSQGLPLSGWLQFNQAKTCLRIQLIPFSGSFLAEGGLKRVIKSYRVSLPLKKDYLPKRVEVEPSVLSRVWSDDIPVVRAGIEIQRSLSFLMASGAKIVPPPEVYPEFIDKRNNERVLEISQACFNSDLLRAIEKDSIPKTLESSSETVSLTLINYLDICIDLGDTLSKLHQVNVIHRDVKESNVLLRIENDGSIAGYLADFDHATHIGWNGFKSEYHYWDFLSQNGYASPLTDGYALAMTLGNVFFPSFYATYKEERGRQKLVRQAPLEWVLLERSILHNEFLRLLKGNQQLRSEVLDLFAKHNGLSSLFSRSLLAFAKSQIDPDARQVLKRIAIDSLAYRPIFDCIIRWVNLDQEVRDYAKATPKVLIEYFKSSETAFSEFLGQLFQRITIPPISDIRDELSRIKAILISESEAFDALLLNKAALD